MRALFVASSSSKFGNSLAVAVARVGVLACIRMTASRLSSAIESWLEFSFYGSDGAWA